MVRYGVGNTVFCMSLGNLSQAGFFFNPLGEDDLSLLKFAIVLLLNNLLDEYNDDIPNE